MNLELVFLITFSTNHSASDDLRGPRLCVIIMLTPPHQDLELGAMLDHTARHIHVNEASYESVPKLNSVAFFRSADEEVDPRHEL